MNKKAKHLTIFMAESSFFYYNFLSILTKAKLFLFSWPVRAPQARPLGRVKGHNIKGDYLAGKPRPLGRGAS
jgi:hypothetical protein